MKKIISFSIWGNDEKYLKGAIDNLLVCPEIYSGWICRFYLRNDVPSKWENLLLTYNAEVLWVLPPYKGDWEGLYWRFYPAADKTIERFVSRDTDSILCVREKVAVDEWVESGKFFHIMRDNHQHSVPMLGGMWGCVGGAIPNIKELINNHAEFNRKGVDQEFLEKFIWPKIYNNHIAHDEFYGNRFSKNGSVRPFPKHGPLPEYSPYVGCIVEDIKKLLRGGKH